MEIATRFLNLLSGLIVLATGIYVELRLTDLLVDSIRLTLGGMAAIYFFVQLRRQLVSRPEAAGVCRSWKFRP